MSVDNRELEFLAGIPSEYINPTFVNPNPKEAPPSFYVAGVSLNTRRRIWRQIMRREVDQYIDNQGTRPLDYHLRATLSETAERRELLSDETKIAHRVFTNTECLINHFAREGFDIVSTEIEGKSEIERKRFHGIWTLNELDHEERMLMALGAIENLDEEAIFDIQKEMHNTGWNAKDHPGLEDRPFGDLIYPAVQEKLTLDHYRMLRRRTRREFRLPQKPTTEELRRGYEFGLSGDYSHVGVDEGRHFGMFDRLSKAAAALFPEYFFPTLIVVRKGFKMPAQEVIANSPEAAAVLNGGGREIALHIGKTFDNMNKGLGFITTPHSKQALWAVRDSVKDFAQGSPRIMELRPNGEFDLVKAA